MELRDGGGKNWQSHQCLEGYEVVVLSYHPTCQLGLASESPPRWNLVLVCFGSSTAVSTNTVASCPGFPTAQESTDARGKGFVRAH